MLNFAKYQNCQLYSSLKNGSRNVSGRCNAQIWARPTRTAWTGSDSVAFCAPASWGMFDDVAQEVSSHGLGVNACSVWTPHRKGLLLWTGLPLPPLSPQQPESVDDNRGSRQRSTRRLEGHLPDQASDKSHFCVKELNRPPVFVREYREEADRARFKFSF